MYIDIIMNEKNDTNSMNDNGEKIDPKRVKKYNRLKIIFSIIEIVLGLALLIIIVTGGFSLRLQEIALGVSTKPYLALLIFTALLGAIEMIVMFPLEFYEGFILEHRFGLSNQTLLGWLWDEVKGLLVGIVLFTPLLLLFYFFLRNLQELWWLPVAGALFLFGVLLSRIAPTLIFPLFYKFVPLEDKDLIRRITKLAEPLGLRISGVFRFNLSKTTKKANAAFTGMGKTKRIILGDTLLENFSHDEIESVFAHELGHYKFGHIWKGILSGFLTTFVGLFLTAQLYSKSLVIFDFTSVHQLAALPLLGLFFTLYGLITMPVQNGISRHFERQADRYAIGTIGDAAPFITSMERLADMNLADKEPHPIIEFWFYSHPAVGKRIEAAKAYNQNVSIK